MRFQKDRAAPKSTLIGPKRPRTRTILPKISNSTLQSRSSNFQIGWSRRARETLQINWRATKDILKVWFTNQHKLCHLMELRVLSRTKVMTRIRVRRRSFTLAGFIKIQIRKWWKNRLKKYTKHHLWLIVTIWASLVEDMWNKLHNISKKMCSTLEILTTKIYNQNTSNSRQKVILINSSHSV